MYKFGYKLFECRKEGDEMKSNELKEKLQQLGIPAYLYNLDSVGRTDERLCLEYSNNEWHVYYSERGVKTTDKIFTSEDEACEYIYVQLAEK